MFHECKTESAEDHNVADLGFRFCQWHRDALDRILTMPVNVFRGMKHMDFWREARPNYNDKIAAGEAVFPVERRVVRRVIPLYKVKQHAIPPQPSSTWAPHKETVKASAFSLAGLISEEASKYATKE
jgi:hypothetical protein